jgi:predicted nucleic acid-binding protein
LYKSCQEVFGEIFIARVPILMSMITLQEAWWGVFRESYRRINRQGTGTKFSRNTYRRHRAATIQNHSHWIEGVAQAIHGWKSVGHPVQIVPDSETFSPSITDAAVSYMRDLALTPDDALHLALAEAHAGTFVTADSDFGKAIRNAAATPPTSLEILHLSKVGT